MKKSDFQIINQRLLRVEHIINENFDNKKIELKVKTEIFVKKNIENKIAEVILTIHAFPDQDIKDVPFKMVVSNKGIFKWTEDIDKDTIGKLLNVNSPAILMSYIRSIVSELSSYSGYPPLILPLIDFTEEKE